MADTVVDIRSETEFAKEEAEMDYDEEEMSGRCAAILSNGKRCPNSADPGSRYCGLPAHQALSDVEGDEVAALAGDEPVLEEEVVTESGEHQVIQEESRPDDRTRAPTRSPPRPRPPRTWSTTRRQDATSEGGVPEPEITVDLPERGADALRRGGLAEPARRRVDHLADRGAGHRPAPRGLRDRRGPGRGRRGGRAGRCGRVAAVRGRAEESA